ncbi:MAG: ATP-binding protein [Phycisphaerales bacterium]|jgi:signal transduction histidine kinase/CHASE3 domain sensor protein
MEQNLREVEVSIWQTIHAADSFRLSGNQFYRELYNEEITNVEEFLSKYANLTNTKEERQFLEEFWALWEEAKIAGNKMIELTEKQKSAEDLFFVNIDEADDVIDFEIQGKWQLTDPNILEKEQAVREVEVSIWEAIHAGQQFTGLSGDITRGEQKYLGDVREAAERGAKASLVKGDFADLMEKQFEDVEEYWAIYKALPLEDFETDAIKKFDKYWRRAVNAGREVVSLHDQAEEQVNILFDKIDGADDVIDYKMQEAIQKRIALQDEKARNVKMATIAIGLLTFLSAVGIGIFTSHFFSSPIIKLKNAAVEIGRGKLNTKVKIKSKDEIGTLAASFNQMTAGLMKSTDELKAANQQLTVNEQQLQSSIRQLEQAQQATLSMAKDLERENAEREKAEENLKALNEKLKRSNKEFRELTRVASHDLREPLRKIVSFGRLLKISLEDKLGDDDKENLEFMMDGIERMQQLVKALRDYSAIITERRQFKNVDLKTIVEELSGFGLADEIKQSGAKIQIQGLLPVVTCNPERIRQVMLNLITNALNYRRKDVTPRVAIRSQIQGNGMARIEICDNGIGIGADQLKNVFAMFKRLHGHNRYDSVGIGLVVCKKIVEQHGGNIGVKSTPGQGSTFWFTVPVAETIKEPMVPALKQE